MRLSWLPAWLDKVLTSRDRRVRRHRFKLMSEAKKSRSGVCDDPPSSSPQGVMQPHLALAKVTEARFIGSP
jgi:hypothetical protein